MSSIYIVVVVVGVAAVASGFVYYNKYKKTNINSDLEKNLPLNLTPKVSNV